MRTPGLLALRWAPLSAAVLAASCALSTPPASSPAASSPPRPPGPPAQSNILRSDYVGSAACAPCHAKETEAWARSPMHHMTRNADAPDIRTPFDGRAMHFKADTVTLDTHDASRFVRIAHAGVPEQVYRVTRVIGGRTREDFVGVRVEASGAPAANAESDEMVLPVSQLLFSLTPGASSAPNAPVDPHALRYKGYSVLLHERSVARPGPVWAETCIFCHNTVPFFSTILGTLRGGTRAGYQGEDVDPLLPADRQWTWSVSDAPGFAKAAADEVEHLGVPRPDEAATTQELLASAITTTREHFDAADLVEIGIGCESCHGGAGDHLGNPAIAPSFLPYAPFLGVARAPSANTAKSEADAHAQAIDRVCARCHQVLFSGYPWTWEGGRRQSADRGGSPVNSGEARDFLLGGCTSALACTACHDPHDASDRRAKNDALATPSGNPVCTRCHSELATDDALRAHSHHDPHGAGGACVACHMARKNMGLDLRLTRYHRIGSPTDPARVILDRPLECALCHADKTVLSLVTTMERWWKKAYSRDLLVRLYGDLGERTLTATLARGKPHERAVAAAALGELGDKSMAPAIARELVNEYPLVRGFAARALVGALGKDCGIDVGTAGVARIEEQARACLASAGVKAPAFPAVSTDTSKGDAEVPED
ncbi:MAG: cytochrome c3 family protein [Polyangiaceae bacterium]